MVGCSSPNWLLSCTSFSRKCLWIAYGLLMRISTAKSPSKKPSDLRSKLNLLPSFVISFRFFWLRLETWDLSVGPNKKSQVLQGGVHPFPIKFQWAVEVEARNFPIERQASLCVKSTWKLGDFAPHQQKWCTTPFRRSFFNRLLGKMVEPCKPIEKWWNQGLPGFLQFIPVQPTTEIHFFGENQDLKGCFFFQPFKIEGRRNKTKPGRVEAEATAVGCFNHWVISAQISFQSFWPNSFVVFDQGGGAQGRGCSWGTLRIPFGKLGEL